MPDKIQDAQLTLHETLHSFTNYLGTCSMPGIVLGTGVEPREEGPPP